ncbi:MAG: GNAT family N-acetyltransferase [Pseudomonadota bacterium]
MSAALSRVEITRDNFDAVVRLRVAPHQKGLVSDNVMTLAEAPFEPGSVVSGLQAGDALVGLMAMIDLAHAVDLHPDDDRDGAYLWRLMIAQGHQGQGYGTQALQFAFAQARAWDRRALYAHVGQDDGNALPFYQRFGFQPTGRVDEGELLLRVSL